MSRPWESDNFAETMQFLVGQAYGPDPHLNLDKVVTHKQQVATTWFDNLERDGVITPNSTVIEIGQGLGIAAEIMSPRVNQLHCVDVSRTFLKYAQERCAYQTNVFFHLIEKNGHIDVPSKSVDLVYSDSVFIHLNHFDIYWYFKQFDRLVVDNGTVIFNIMSQCESLEDDITLFEEFAQLYKEQPQNMDLLLFYPDEMRIKRIARRFNFNCVRQRDITTQIRELTFERVNV